eukprot:TRINITY_DN9465_c0_g1_i1.p1 TRINITY_DN9465_c0_g1~~TRINITY_DN9465_c0_g1_i1.p1  ORF type:complete len:693 (-),score=157.42 TRINITY_DN9465_c0_g1_i1:181-2259(-)
MPPSRSRDGLPHARSGRFSFEHGCRSARGFGGLFGCRVPTWFIAFLCLTIWRSVEAERPPNLLTPTEEIPGSASVRALSRFPGGRRAARRGAVLAREGSPRKHATRRQALTPRSHGLEVASLSNASLPVETRLEAPSWSAPAPARPSALAAIDSNASSPLAVEGANALLALPEDQGANDGSGVEVPAGQAATHDVAEPTGKDKPRHAEHDGNAEEDQSGEAREGGSERRGTGEKKKATDIEREIEEEEESEDAAETLPPDYTTDDAKGKRKAKPAKAADANAAKSEDTDSLDDFFGTPNGAIDKRFRDEDMAVPVDTSAKSMQELLFSVGGGTGASLGSGNITQDRELLMCMRYQDEAVFFMLIIVYFATLAFSASFIYRQVANNSSITYYADPRKSNLAIDTNSMEDFLDEFNRTPEEVRMQVTGYVVSNAVDYPSQVVEWQGECYRTAFAFTLDLSPWVQKASGPYGQSLGSPPLGSNEEGIALSDIEGLREFLGNNSDDLCSLDMIKTISWPKWEELAMNIKHRVRQHGFRGLISVHRTELEELTVYKNRHWANFMHSRTLKVLCALSVVGWIAHGIYMKLKCKKLVVRSFHTVDISIEEYWPYIESQLRETGFSADASMPLHTPNPFVPLGPRHSLSGAPAGPLVDSHGGASDSFILEGDNLVGTPPRSVTPPRSPSGDESGRSGCRS